jgi:hypothetical protein
MGSGSSKTSDQSENKKNEFTITYRVKLPDNPIISKEKDENYLFIYTIEEIEKAKLFMNIGNSNLLSYFGSYTINLSIISYAPVILLFFYRRFRIKKNNTKIKSFLKSFPIFIFYYYLTLSIMGSIQTDSYLNFLKQDLNKTNEEINEFLNFKLEYADKLI